MSRDPNYGALLPQWLPAVWRERDQHGDLEKLLSVYGELLDALHNTVIQLHDDAFAVEDPGFSGRGDSSVEMGRCQDWLLPYLGQLMDVRQVSPSADGRNAEVRDAIFWRQRKGSRVAVERIAETIGQFEVEVQEGWKRVAISPRVDRPLLPEPVYGEPPIPETATAAMRARHPGLPTATLDLRYCSRAVRSDATNPAARQTRFAGTLLHWRQAQRHGVPCAPASFQDVSRRTPDLRTPPRRSVTIDRGGFHPRKVLLYTGPAPGFFSPQPDNIRWTALAPLVAEATAIDLEDWSEDEHVSCTLDGLRLVVGRSRWDGRDLPLIQLTGLGAAPLRVRGVVELTEPALYRFENLWLDNRLHIDAGVAQLTGCAAREFHVSTAERDQPVIDARGCLFKRLLAPRGLLRLEYVTVLERLVAERLRASDCILNPPLHRDTIDDDVPEAGCLRYSRVFHIPSAPDPGDAMLINDPLWVAQGKRSALRVHAPSCVTLPALFWSETFGEPGCGVLHPDAYPVLRNGAEDGGEMGGGHDLHLVLRERAALDKLKDFLPLGIEAILVADKTLTCAPPRTED